MLMVGRPPRVQEMWSGWTPCSPCTTLMALVGAAAIVTAQTAPPPAPGQEVTWSGLTVMPCDAASESQQFWAPAAGEQGQIEDRQTGRCVSVLDCELPSTTSPLLVGSKMGVAVLDACGTSRCGRQSQLWRREPSPPPSTASEFVSAIARDGPTPWRLMATFGPNEVDGQYVVVQQIASGYKNTEVTPGSGQGSGWGQLKLALAANADGVYAYGSNCPDNRIPGGCCLQAKPCVHPCVLLLSTGWKCVLAASAIAVVYVGGGVVHSVKSKGQQLARSNWAQLLPHGEHWFALVALVVDGCAFCHGRCRAYSGAQRAAPSQTEPAQASATRESGERASRSIPERKDKKDKKGKKDKMKKDKREKHKTEGNGGDQTKPPMVPTSDAPLQEPLVGTAAGGGGRWVHVTS